ncbi:MAG: glycosyltransferase [Moraxella sp.]|nr:glycosyltransferase [Moraxella sp.]
MTSKKTGGGGVTSAIFTRSHHFYNDGIACDILTFDYNPDYDKTISDLKSKGKMDARTKMINMFDYFGNKSSQTRNTANTYNAKYFLNELSILHSERCHLKKTDTIHHSECMNLKLLVDSAHNYYLPNGELKYYARYENDRLLLIDCFMKGKRDKRIIFKNGLIKTIEYFNDENKIYGDVLFDKKGYPFITRDIIINDKGQPGIYNITLLDNHTKFENKTLFSRYFLDTLIADSHPHALICDGMGNFSKILNLTQPIKKYAVIHSHHCPSGIPNQNHASAFKHAKELDGIIILTNKQKENIHTEYGVNNLMVIPNFININQNTPSPLPQKQTIGHISRLAGSKGLERLVDIIDKLRLQLPDVVLKLFGTGPLEMKLKTLVRERNLEKHILFCGYTNNARQEIQNFDCVVSTSFSEGFGLSIAEAMEQGRPVVAFDVDYGPSALIENDVSGILINDGDIQSFADALVKLLTNDELAKKMGANARQKIHQELHHNLIMNLWKQILNIS